MKQTYLNKEWLFNKSGEFCGVNLGSDFTSEHEWGIDGIKASFGVNNTIKKRMPGSRLFSFIFKEKTVQLFGIDARKMTTRPNGFTVLNKDGVRGIGHYDWNYDNLADRWFGSYMKDAVRLIKDKDLAFVAWWSSKGFFIASRDTSKLDAIMQAIVDKDLAFILGSRKVFSNGGLILAIASKLDRDVLDELEDGDRDYYEVLKASDASGIHEILKKSNKTYYALSPSWRRVSGQRELVFWLNPANQHLYNSGWYSVDELKQWAQDEGPIMKDVKELQDAK